MFLLSCTVVRENCFPLFVFGGTVIDVVFCGFLLRGKGALPSGLFKTDRCSGLKDFLPCFVARLSPRHYFAKLARILSKNTKLKQVVFFTRTMQEDWMYLCFFCCHKSLMFTKADNLPFHSRLSGVVNGNVFFEVSSS